MRITRWIIILSAFVLTVSACDNSSEKNNSKETKTLISSSGLPKEDLLGSEFTDPLLDAVEEESNGSLQFDRFYGGELVEEGKDLDALNSNTIDFAASIMTTYNPDRYPYAQVTGLPVLDMDASIYAEAIENLMDSDKKIKDGKTFYELEFEDKNLVAFPANPTEGYVIGMNEQVFKSIDDINSSVRIRMTGKPHELFLKHLGVSPVTIEAGDSYDAMSRGSIEGVMFSLPDMKTWGLDEPVSHVITELNIGVFQQYVGMKQETWDSLSSDVQKTFEEKSSDLIYKAADAYIKEQENVQKEMDSEFISVNDLDPDVQSRIDKAIVLTWEEWIEDLEDKGHAGKEIALLWRDILEDAGTELPPEVLELK